MSYEIYKLIHLFAIISLFLSIGALLSYSGNKKQIMILHGLAGLILFISGFGLIARLKNALFPSMGEFKTRYLDYLEHIDPDFSIPKNQ